MAFEGKQIQFFLNFNVYLFLRDRKTEHKQGRERERHTHRIGSRFQALGCQPEPNAGLKLRNREMVT